MVTTAYLKERARKKTPPEHSQYKRLTMLGFALTKVPHSPFEIAKATGLSETIIKYLQCGRADSITVVTFATLFHYLTKKCGEKYRMEDFIDSGGLR